MTTSKLLLAAAAISLALPAATTADAASRHKNKYYRHHYYGAAYAPGYYGPGYRTWAPVQMRTPGPIWAMPNECYTDEGYGRYTPCSLGRGTR